MLMIANVFYEYMKKAQCAVRYITSVTFFQIHYSFTSPYITKPTKTQPGAESDQS